MKKFEAKILINDGGGAFVEIPFNVENEYGKKGQIKVKARFDGCDYRGSLAKMGHPCHILLVRKDVREQIGKGPGDLVVVEVQEDLEERVVNIPNELTEVLEKSPHLAKKFNMLSYTNRKEYAQWIDGAKRPATKATRLIALVQKIEAGLKNPYDKG